MSGDGRPIPGATGATGATAHPVHPSPREPRFEKPPRARGFPERAARGAFQARRNAILFLQSYCHSKF